MVFLFYKNFIFFLFFLIFLLLTIAITTLVERKVMASIQRRRGPNVVGIFGFLQPIADGLKLFIKEIILPSNSNVFIFLLAPVFTFFCSIMLWVVIPFGEAKVLIDFPFSILYLLAVSSLGVYGIIFSGWSSNSKYAFLGGLRSAAQMISYEVCIGFVFIVMIIMTNSFSLVEIVKSQEYVWFIFPLFPLWLVLFVSALAETNRAPFDLPEAEAELVAGYNVEYSSIAFALFFLAEYGNIVLMSALMTIFFFGGWLPFPFLSFLPDFITFALKVTIHVFIFVWIRAAFPRYRYDQLMKLGWKVLMPISVCFVYIIGFILLNIYVLL
ncbi:NADH dehydrogenase subunit 1 (mitochondrion) [Naegleria fowleri]|uniref:NADH-ubiquinone oxidoreductase chain 1 n=1 Tax=Naegleria fowleri TaxID=5763 RepID=M4H654_NAEFO|nr:NADH dehydrogenase subunit 1 [Naegleria fowleri]AFP72293.1 NADH dehydrogenase subunit 1 [Naegleria fowleri]AOS85616.1 Nad1 [Naegleria fowleri]AOS85662.1 Nad1 [Naegleria fowleri]UAT97061.1 NADH dehydrogenase subunit 1 [Naegleria fowleri]WND64430.1 NADH-quinone oxidoreductase subunit H [Naegleria fowleri]